MALQSKGGWCKLWAKSRKIKLFLHLKRAAFHAPRLRFDLELLAGFRLTPRIRTRQLKGGSSLQSWQQSSHPQRPQLGEGWQRTATLPGLVPQALSLSELWLKRKRSLMSSSSILLCNWKHQVSLLLLLCHRWRGAPAPEPTPGYRHCKQM